MLIYFIRHGQTDSNKVRRFQTSDTPLSLEGEGQALKLAERFKDTEINEIWTSPMKRAQHTAEIINQYHQVTLTEKIELKEIKRPTVVEGKLYSDPSIKDVRDKLLEQEHDPDFKYQDGESFTEVVTRVKKVIKMLEAHSVHQPNDWSLVVAAHGIVLATLLVCILLGEDATPRIVRNAITRTKLQNTGISVATFQDETWKLITLNDFAHL
jgi:broad specificity phosphatase PhoE